MTGKEYIGNRTRLDAAIDALLLGKVRKVDRQGRKPTYYHVEGPVRGRKGGVTHRATVIDGTPIICTCADFIFNLGGVGLCYHMQAAQFVEFASA